MKVLITGAYGNLGLMCVRQALALGYELSCLDLDTPANRKAADEFYGLLEAHFGDIRDTQLLDKVLDDVDAIIHNASLLPPLTENMPELAQAINVEACKQLIRLAENKPKKPRFIFPSSVTVFGYPEAPYSVKTANDAVTVSDNYTAHKLAIEAFLRESSLPWVVLRVGVSVDARTLATDRATFSKLLAVKASNPLEYVHPKDVALAMCQAVQKPQAVNKVLLIGGGESCQITQREFLSTAFEALGLSLPTSVHGEDAFYTHWMDTEESQAILHFQQHDFATYQAEMRQCLKWLSYLLWPLRPLLQVLLAPILRRL